MCDRMWLRTALVLCVVLCLQVHVLVLLQQRGSFVFPDIDLPVDSSAMRSRSRSIELSINWFDSSQSSLSNKMPIEKVFSYAGREDREICQRIYQLTSAARTPATTESEHLITHGNVTCFRQGTLSGAPVNGTCHCKSTWHGPACSFPSVLYRSVTPWRMDKLTLRHTARRVVHAFPFNIEFDMLELRFAELADVVDVFIVVESNFTAYGMPKPLRLLQRLRNGTYSHVHSKLIYVSLDVFPRQAHKDGWIIDRLMRNYIGTHGIPRIKGLNSDDLFVLTDADEIPCREAITFLKWHDGYTEPVFIKYHWHVYGFFWSKQNDDGQFVFQEIPAVVTMGMVELVFKRQVFFIRQAEAFTLKHKFDVMVGKKMWLCTKYNGSLSAFLHHVTDMKSNLLTPARDEV
jgi:Glycosyltransferase family 17